MVRGGKSRLFWFTNYVSKYSQPHNLATWNSELVLGTQHLDSEYLSEYSLYHSLGTLNSELVKEYSSPFLELMQYIRAPSLLFISHSLG